MNNVAVINRVYYMPCVPAFHAMAATNHHFIILPLESSCLSQLNQYLNQPRWLNLSCSLQPPAHMLQAGLASTEVGVQSDSTRTESDTQYETRDFSNEQKTELLESHAMACFLQRILPRCSTPVHSQNTSAVAS